MMITQPMSKSTRYQQAKRVTLIGAFINTLLGVSKLLGGIVFHSSALIADGFHSLSDLFTDGMVLIASKYGSQDADDAHPYGHQRIETAATYILASLLILTGVAIAWDALSQIYHHRLEHPKLLALPIAALSMLANEALFWYTRYIGRAIQSPLIIANAWHHRSDAGSSFIVLIGLLGSIAGFPTLDGVAAMLVGLLIIKMGVDYGWKSIKELVDTAALPEQRFEIKKIICSTDGVVKVHQLRSRFMGDDIFVDVHIQVQPMLSVSEGHFIAQNVHFRLLNHIPGVKDVTVHVDPEDDEITQPSQNLPNRDTLNKNILHTWYDAFPEINTCLLHYLDGKLTIDLIGDLDEHTQNNLRMRIIEDIKTQPGAISIRIQPPAKTLYKDNSA
jgi:cation diffusion facilitator family transporter